MLCYAVIDTNVLVSALLARTKATPPVLVIEKLYADQVIPVVCQSIIKEYHDVLLRPKFNFPKPLIASLLDFFSEKGKMVIPSPTGEVLPDLSDLPFYEVTMSNDCENTFLVTGNTKHFPHKPNIVTPREFLDILESAPWPHY
jgi:putative toxin-antitoxin system toxin component, PIN family